MSKPKKKFSETKVGSFLSKAAPGILGIAGDFMPDAGVLGIVKNFLDKNKDAGVIYFESESALTKDVVEA